MGYFSLRLAINQGRKEGNCERLSGVISLGTEVCVCVCVCVVCVCVCSVCVCVCVCVVCMCVWCVCVVCMCVCLCVWCVLISTFVPIFTKFVNSTPSSSSVVSYVSTSLMAKARTCDLCSRLTGTSASQKPTAPGNPKYKP